MTDSNALILEDNPFDQRILATILRALGFDSIESEESTIQAFERVNQGTLSVVFVDIVLPEGNGLEFLKLIRSSEHCRFPDIPVVIVSAHSELKWVKRSIEYGADDFVVKPMSPEQIIRKVEPLLRGDRPAFTRWKLQAKLGSKSQILKSGSEEENPDNAEQDDILEVE